LSFSFGQRLAGKTFTMFAGVRHFKYRGVIPRAVSYVFHELEKFTIFQFPQSGQFLQIYHDIIYDLRSDDEKEMELAENEYRTPFVHNLSEHQVTDVHTALQLLIASDAKLNLTEHKFAVVI
jgi:kinesin family protein 6/9